MPSTIPPRLNKANTAIRDLMQAGMPEMDAIREQLTPKQLMACQTHLQGGTLRECLKSSMGEKYFNSLNTKGRFDTGQTFERVFNYLQRRYISLAKEKIEKDSLMNATERRAFLASVVRTPIGDVDADSPLAQMCETRQLKGGGEATRVSMPDKLTAIRLDAELSGDLEDKKQDQQINIALMLGRLPDTSGIPQVDIAASAVVAKTVATAIEAKPLPPATPAIPVKRKTRQRKPQPVEQEEV